MVIAFDIPEDRRSIGTGRLCLLMGLTLLTIALTFSQRALEPGKNATGSGETLLAAAVLR